MTKCIIMNGAKETARIADVAQITSGHPFRGRVPEVHDGEARVAQMKDVDNDGRLDWAGMVRTSLAGMRRKPDWLREGDILFLARGSRNLAVYVEEPPDDALASPHFFLIRVKKAVNVMPAFLAWQINQRPAQRYFGLAAEGTLQRHVRRTELERLPLVVPPLEVQQLAVDLDRCARAEVMAYEKLIENRKRILEAAALGILDANKKDGK